MERLEVFDDRGVTYIEKTTSYIHISHHEHSYLRVMVWWYLICFFGSLGRYTHSSTIATPSGSKDLYTEIRHSAIITKT